MHSCSKCDNTWGGMAQAHCGVCHDTFSGVTAFDRHRSNGKCKSPDTVGLELRTSGATPVWAFPTDVDYNERFKTSVD